MELTITKIKLQNFLCYKEAEFDIKTGKHLISGVNNCEKDSDSNGSGKTSLLIDPILYTFYKYTSRYKDLSHFGGGNGFTEVHFEREEKYRIRRYINDKKEGNAVKIFLNEEDITPKRKPEADKEVLNIVGIPQDLFMSAITIPQEMPLNFTQLQPTMRKGVIEEILGFSVWDKFREIFKSAQEEKNKRMRAIEIDFSEEKEKLVKLNAIVEEKKNNKDKNTTELAEKKKKLEEEIQSYHTKLEKLNTAFEEATGGKTLKEINKEISNALSSIQITKNVIKEKTSIIDSGVCPTCDQHYPVETLQKVEDELEEKKYNLKSFKSKYAELEKIQESSKKVYEKKDKIQNFVSSTKRILEDTSEELNNVTTDEEIESLENNLNEIHENVNERHKQLKDFQNYIAKISDIDKMLLPSSEFRAKILDMYIRTLNQVMDEISPLIFQDIKIAFYLTEKGGLEFSIQKKGKEFSHKDLSGGEKKRVDIIIIFSLQRFILEFSGIRINLLGFDEIFNFLDRKGVEYTVDNLQNLFGEDHALFVMSHDNALKIKFDSILKITKSEDGVSEIDTASYIEN